ncbi:MAG TPA: DinB family protein [Candidatus Dormibacteraeota bacterium]|nr:DinB family protein [Candidatus Dormibacteraeota bacterium]
MADARVIPHQRLPVPQVGDEKAMLAGFLDRYRETMLWKLDGLTTEQATRRLVPSASTLLGIVKHLAYVERWWFQMSFAGGPINFPWPEDEPDQDIDFRIQPADTVESIIALYKRESARSREIVAAASLDDLAKNTERGPRSLRWIMIHMIDETARHAGHADILRELTDGAIGQ